MENTMSDANTSSAKPVDPMAAFRVMRDAYLDTMAKSLTEAVNTESYAQANGAMLDSFLTVSTPFKEALDKSMLQALEQLSLPSRLDIISLAERFTNLEMRLDDMDAKLDNLVRLAKPSVPPAATHKTPGKQAAKAIKASTTRKQPARKKSK
jgi:hypothetical protein